jgi:hypothetical protein
MRVFVAQFFAMSCHLPLSACIRCCQPYHALQRPCRSKYTASLGAGTSCCAATPDLRGTTRRFLARHENGRMGRSTLQIGDRSPYERRLYSELAGILQVKIRQQVSGVRMLIPIFGEESMRSFWSRDQGTTGILRNPACSLRHHSALRVLVMDIGQHCLKILLVSRYQDNITC